MPGDAQDSAARTRRGQAEVLDTVFLVAIVVIGVSITGLAVVTSVQERASAESVPIGVTGDAADSWAAVTHAGGDGIPLSQLDLVVRGANGSTTYPLTDAAVTLDGDGDALFEPGEVANVTHPYSGEITVLLVDRRSPAVVRYSETFDVSGTAPPADTLAIDRFDVNDTSSGSDASFTVDWRATDSGADITSATVSLRDQETGTLVDSRSYSFAETADTGNQTATLENASGIGRVYVLEVAVTDAAGNTVERTLVDTADSEVTTPPPPIVRSYTITDTTQGNEASYEAAYNVTDEDGDLVEVELTLVNADTGALADNVTDTYSQTNATGVVTRTLTAGSQTKSEMFYVNVTATDLNGGTATSSVLDTADGDGGGGGGAVAPNVTQFDARDESSSAQGLRYVVDWNVTDEQSDLDSVTVEVIDTSKNNPQVIDSQTYDTVPGDTAADQTVLTDSSNKYFKNNQPNLEVTVRITATDTEGNTATESWVDTVDGSGSN